MDDGTLLGRSAARAPQPTESRRDARRQLLWKGVLQTAQEPHACIVADLSPGGAKLLLNAPLKVGQPVTLLVAGLGAYRGSVVWEESGAIGISFA